MRYSISAATVRGIWRSAPVSRQHSDWRSHLHLAVKGAHIFIQEANTAVGHRPTHRPAMGFSMKSSAGAALNRDPLIAIVGITATAITVKPNPVAAKGIGAALVGDAIARHWMHPHRYVDFLQHFEATGGGLPAGHSDGNGKRLTQRAALEQQQATAFAQHHHLETGLLTQLLGHSHQCVPSRCPSTLPATAGEVRATATESWGQGNQPVLPKSGARFSRKASRPSIASSVR